MAKPNYEKMTIAELAATYNELAEGAGKPPVKKFKDKATGIRRITELLNSGKKSKKTTTGERKPRGMNFNFPPGPVQKPIREGTDRAIIFKLMSREKGASFEEMLEATSWGNNPKWDDDRKKRNVYEAIRLLHFYSGYGLEQDEKGNIHIINPNK